MADETPVGANGAVTEPEVPVNPEVATDAEPKGGEVAPQGTENEGDPKPKKLGGWQRKQLKAEQEAEYWRNVALETLAKNKPAVVEAPKEPEDKRPRKEDFIVDKEAQTYDPEAYEEALLAWNRRQAVKEFEERQTKREQEKAQQTEAQKQISTWTEEFNKAKASGEFDDIDEVFATTPIQPNSTVAKFLLKNASDVGIRIGYHLGTHPEELDAIQKMPHEDALVALGELRASIKAGLAAKNEPEKEEEETPAPVVTKAAPPPQTVKKPTVTKGIDIFDPNLPFKDFVKARNASLRKG